MFSNNEQISGTQVKKLLIFDMISISIIILPRAAAAGAGRDGLTAIVLGSFGAIIYSLFFLFIVNRIKGDYIEFSTRTAGKILTLIFNMLYIAKYVFACWFALSLFAKIINDTLLPDTSIKIIILALILVSIYAAAKGIEVRARIAEIFFFIAILPLILLFIFGFNRIEFTNLFPLVTEEPGAIFGTSYLVLLTYSAVEALIFAVPSFSVKETKEQRRKSVLQAILATALINVILFILCIGLLGLPGTQNQSRSSIIIMQLIQLPGGFVQRQDAIMLSIWMLTIFSLLSAYFYYLSKITDSFIPLKSKSKKTYIIFFYGIVLFLLSFIRIPLETLSGCFEKYMIYIGFPQSICIPLIVMVIAKLRKGKV